MIYNYNLFFFTMKNKYRIALIIIALLGVLIMGYLFSLHYSDSGEESFCNLGEGISCDVVNKSEYSVIFGVPVSLMGLLYFLGILLMALFKYDRKYLKLATLVSIMFLGPSLYLTGIEIFKIRSICVLCEASKLLILLVVMISSIAIKPEEKIGSKGIMSAVLVAVLLAGITYFIQAPREDPDAVGVYDGFAQCLYKESFRMYGSATCASCAKQRKLFGSAHKYLHEIECDPRNANTDILKEEVKACAKKNISKTPTWIHEDKNGNNIFKFEAGIISLEDLSKASGCALPVSEK